METRLGLGLARGQARPRAMYRDRDQRRHFRCESTGGQQKPDKFGTLIFCLFVFFLSFLWYKPLRKQTSPRTQAI